tara:strand:- start:100 stop:717 length:618 start_codon:yes stop_codon:yes gene_type:complete
MFCKTNKLYFTVNNINILDNISISIANSKSTAIFGKNGSGKSTLLRCINCLLTPTSGSLEHKYNYPFPMLFQNPVLFQNTVQYNFEILCRIKKIQPSMKWYNSFQLNKISSKKIIEVSEGEKQKIYLSRILSTDPKVIIMDEPSQNLDQASDRKLLDLILEEKNKNKTIIFSSHDISFIKNVADNLILLEYGKIRFIGNPSKFFL